MCKLVKRFQLKFEEEERLEIIGSDEGDDNYKF